MRAGRLRHKVILQQPGGSQNTVGERVTSWSNIATVRADIEPLRANEIFAGGQQQASSTHRIRIRYDSALASMDGSWRVAFGSRVFTIDGPPLNIRERNRELLLMCTEGLRTE